MILTPLYQTGSSRTGTLNCTYDELVAVLGFTDNATKLDDTYKVKARWGFVDEKGRQGFIWCYKHSGSMKTCTYWSTDGDKTLLTELFGDKFTSY